MDPVEELVRAICRQEGIPCRRIQALGGGQVNAVYRVDGGLLVRIGARPDAGQRLRRETLLLQSLEGLAPVAQVLAFGQVQGRFYQVQRFLPGRMLYLLWKDLGARQQDAIAAQLAEALQALHAFAYPDFGAWGEEGPRYPTWRDDFCARFAATVAEIRALNLRMVPGALESALEYLEERQGVLQEGRPTLVHCDLTLVNILAQRGRLTALLDFEFARQAPLDYELLAMEAFCLYPNDWAEEEREVYCSADFAGFLPLLRRHYPALFEVEHLRERVNLYQLYTTLHSYLEWRKANLASIPPERMAARGFYLGRIYNILYDNGARMFFA